MPPHSYCSYHSCGRGLLDTKRELSKSQRDHVIAAHTNIDLNFPCPYTSRKTLFKRQPDRAMDFVCFCNATFTLGSSLARHFKSCKVAEQRVLQADIGQNAASERDSASFLSGPITRSLASQEPPTPSPLDLKPYELQQHDHHERQSLDQQHSFLRAFTETTSTQHRELLKTMTEQHLQFMQSMRQSAGDQYQQNQQFMRSMMQSSGEQHQEHQKAMTDQHCQLLRSLTEQFRQISELSERQSNAIQQGALRQHAQTRRTIEDVLQHQRENSYLLEVHERILDKLTVDKLAVDSQTHK
jgi:hypothetical protein